MQIKPLLKMLALMAAGMFLSSFTLVLGAVPLHLWRQRYGRMSFLFGMTAMIMVCYQVKWLPLVASLAGLAFLVTVFNELDEARVSLPTSVFLSGLLTSAFVAGAGYLWLQEMGSSWQQLLKPPVESFLTQVEALNGAIKVNYEEILMQIPSGLIILSFVCLLLALLMEDRLRPFFDLPPKHREIEFVHLRLPDVFIWILMAALLATFLKQKEPMIQSVGANLLNVFVFFYFLQGMAVATHLFYLYKVSPFWKTFLTFLMVMQFFLFVSCIGFVDYWVDFRRKLTKSSEDKKINEKGGIS